MKQKRVGKTGLFVSELGLGTLTWGRDTNLEEARGQLEIFTDAGGTLIDTAATYGDGESEYVVGSLLTSEFSRDDYVICSKAGIMHLADGQTVVNTSRSTLLNTLNQTLSNLGTDYLDIWFVHHHDPNTPVAETLSALETAVHSGKVRYLGVSNFPAWAMAEIATLLHAHGLELAVSQNEYSLLNRRVEREVLPAAQHFGTGFFAWSPLGRGVLTGKYRGSLPPDSRAASSHLRGFIKPYLTDSYRGIVDATCAAAEGLDWKPLQMALAWVKDAPGVSCALTGARTKAQLNEILQGHEKVIPHQIRKALDDISTSH